MMARKDRFSQGYSIRFDGHFESEGSGCSGQIDTEFTASEDSTAPRQKWVDLNCTSRDGFDVPLQAFSLSKLSTVEKKQLIMRLRSELAKVHVLLKKIESNKTSAMTVSSSSDILSCSNVKKRAHTRNPKKTSDTISIPGKNSNSSDRRRTSAKFESGNKGPVSNSNALLLKQCENLLKKLMSHQFAWVFNKPVDVVALNIPDYFTVIKKPMDLGTVKSNLGSGKYASPADFAADVRLTFSNAMTYNPPANNVHIWADTMIKFFEARWKVIAKNLPENSSQTLPERSRIREVTEVVKPTSNAKKRKLSPSQHMERPETMYKQKVDGLARSEPVKTQMTEDEKSTLIRELEPLLEDLPDSISNFLRDQTSSGAQVGEDEIEIDIDNLQNDALFTLRKLLDEHLQEKRKNDAKGEVCEIELRHESGISSSSMQVDKGNGVLDEDAADIGDNEPPVSSYPPIEVQNDADSQSLRSGGTIVEALMPIKSMQPSRSAKDSHGRVVAEDLSEGIQPVSGLDQLEQSSLEKPISDASDDRQGESASTERQDSPERLYRAAVLKDRFAETILKAREKTLSQGDKVDPETLRREREELEMQRKKERARLQAEAKAAEDARKRAEAEAAAEAKRRRELEREAARQALLKIEKTVEINENSQFLEDLEMLRAGLPEQLPCSVDEGSPDRLQGDFGSFKFGASNPLEQLGLYIKEDDEEEEVEPPGVAEDEVVPPVLPESVNDDVEEGEID